MRDKRGRKRFFLLKKAYLSTDKLGSRSMNEVDHRNQNKLTGKERVHVRQKEEKEKEKKGGQGAL